jgi:molecular chaperone GrpE
MYKKIIYREIELADKDEPLTKTDTHEPYADAPEAQENGAGESVETAACKEEKSEIQECQDQLTVEKDRVLRLSAEFENYKKRSSKELNEFKKFANETLLKQLLNVIDNMERAISSATKDKGDVKTLIEGIEMTHREMLRIMEMFNVKHVEAEGQCFDPAFHQAVTQIESDDHPANTVITEFQKGYLFHDRLLRPSMVVVSKATTKQETEK